MDVNGGPIGYAARMLAVVTVAETVVIDTYDDSEVREHGPQIAVESWGVST